ncbi:hypothetical protein R1sor_012138 [Riccia sorocarpa]|uniref:Uncharacterized protein n=1 Tax=Riccia sorocarpa TaxID=122646 RepID=A0ABD3I5M3_9MARC
MKRKEVQLRVMELQTRLRQASTRRSRVADEETKILLAKVRRLEEEQAILWRRWSSLRWVREGEASSKFFFSLLKAKHAKEEIMCLTTDEGQKIEEETTIMQELHQFYTNLYHQDAVSAEDTQLRKKTLALIDKKVSVQQNEMLIAVSGPLEIMQVVSKLKNDKAPGIDGMTAEFLNELWMMEEKEINEFVLQFWNTDTLSWKKRIGVIKLIPKSGDRQKLKNWRPLTLLNTGYKLGRRIANTILNFLTCKELAERTQ